MEILKHIKCVLSGLEIFSHEVFVSRENQAPPPHFILELLFPPLFFDFPVQFCAVGFNFWNRLGWLAISPFIWLILELPSLVHFFFLPLIASLFFVVEVGFFFYGWRHRHPLFGFYQFSIWLFLINFLWIWCSVELCVWFLQLHWQFIWEPRRQFVLAL